MAESSKSSDSPIRVDEAEGGIRLHGPDGLNWLITHQGARDLADRLTALTGAPERRDSYQKPLG